MSAHAWAVAGLVLLPLAVWVPLWLLDADRAPANETVQEQPPDEPDDDEPALLAA